MINILQCFAVSAILFFVFASVSISCCVGDNPYRLGPRAADGSIKILPEETTDEKCPNCVGPMAVKRGRYGLFLACQAYPDCKGTRPVSIGVKCPNNCGGYVAERRSHRGRIFYGCSSYPNCTFASWDRPVTGPCPVCGKPDWCLVAEDGSAAICARIEEGSVKRCGDAGWLHILRENGYNRHNGHNRHRYCAEQ